MALEQAANPTASAVGVLARVVPASVHGGDVKATLAFRPVRSDAGGLPIDTWPGAIEAMLTEALLRSDAFQIVPIGLNAGEPLPKPGGGEVGSLRAARWAERQGDIAVVNRLWSSVIPPTWNESPWVDFVKGLETSRDVLDRVPPDVVCISGRDGDIVLLTKMARAIETVRTALSEDREVAERTIFDKAREAAKSVLEREEYKEFFQALDAHEQTVGPGTGTKNNIQVMEARRALATTVLIRLASRCAEAQQLGAALGTDATVTDLADSLVMDTAGETCSCEHLNGVLSSIYTQLFELQIEHFCANLMGEEEYGKLKESIENREDDEQSQYRPPETASGSALGDDEQTVREEFTSRRLFGLDETPDLGRLFRTFVDVRIDLGELSERLGLTGEGEAFFFIRLNPKVLPSADPGLSPWTLAKLRRADGAVDCLPAPRAELLLAAAGRHDLMSEVLTQRNGVALLGGRKHGKPRYELVSTDVAGAAQEAQSRGDRMLDLALPLVKMPEEGAVAPWAPATEDHRLEPTAIRSGGLSLLNFACAAELSRSVGFGRELARMDAADRFLDADDLAMGRLPVLGVLHPVDAQTDVMAWRRLSGKTVRYGGSDEAGVRSADELIEALYPEGDRTLAQSSVDRAVPQRKRLVGKSVDGEAKDYDLAKMNEAEATYLGDPMGIETGLSERDSPIRPDLDISIDRDIDLPKRGEADDEDLALPLRFGLPSRIAFLIGYLGGGTLNAEAARRALDTTPDAAVPPLPSTGAQIEGRRYLRSEAVAPVGVLVPRTEAQAEVNAYRSGRQPDYPPQTTGTVTLRTTLDANGNRVGPEPAAITRIVLPPMLNLEAAERHGVFDDIRPGWFRSGDPVFDRIASIPRWRTEYHRTTSLVRPRDGLRNVHLDAAWGQAPMLVHQIGASADLKAIVGAEVDDGRAWLDLAKDWSRDLETWRNTGSWLDGDESRQTPPSPPPTPSGDAVFAAHSTKRVGQGRTVPFYPDPMASSLVLRVRLPGAPVSANGLVTQSLPIVEAGIYPDVRPVALRIVPAAPGAPPEIVESGTTFEEGCRCRALTVAVPPGRDYVVDLWCCPSEAALAGWSELVDTAATLRQTGAFCQGDGFPEVMPGCPAPDGDPNCGLLGQPAPSARQLKEMAGALWSAMNVRPVPELARHRSIEVRHAVTRPLAGARPVPPIGAQALITRRVREATTQGPELLGAETLDCPTAMPEQWFLGDDVANAVAGGTEVDLGGFLEVDLGSTGAVEITAAAVALDGRAIDDPARSRGAELVQRGGYPRTERDATQPDGRLQKVSEIYGFEVDRQGRVRLPISRGLWAQFSNLPRTPTPATDDCGETGHGYVSLHTLFAKKSGQDAGRFVDARVNPLFADTRARRLGLTFRAISRFANEFTRRPRISDGDFVKGEPLLPEEAHRTTLYTADELWIPASERPARPGRSAEALPMIEEHATGHQGRRGAMTSVSRRISRVRLWFDRPWFTSGEDERLGLVIWPRLDRQAERYLYGTRKTGRHRVIRPSVADTPGPVELGDRMILDEFEDRYLPGIAKFLTRWGSDPIEEFPAKGWCDWIVPNSVFADFEIDESGRRVMPLVPDADCVVNVAMPIPDPDEEVEGESPQEAEARRELRRQRFLNVDLLTYVPRFDVDQELWYVDVALDPGPMISPFLRLGVVRYQEHAPRDLQVSEPAEPFELQLLTHRETRVRRRDDPDDPDRIIVEVDVTGPVTHLSEAEADDPALRDSIVLTAMHIRISHTRRFEKESVVLPTRVKDGEGRWTTTFRLLRSAVDAEHAETRIQVEESAARLPSSYLARNSSADVLGGQSTRYMCTLRLPPPAVDVTDGGPAALQQGRDDA